MPAVVLFDLFNTLVSGGDAERDETCAAMAGDLGVEPDVFTRLFRASWPDRATGAMGDLEATVRTLASRAGGSPSSSAVRLACARRLAVTRRLLWPKPSTLATLDALRAAGWRTGVVSNCTVETGLLWKRTPLAPRFEAAALSCELGVAKPDPAIFLAACSSLGVAPTDCLYVGDGADNELAAAANLGMTVIQTEEYVPAAGSWPRQRITSLVDLVDALRAQPTPSGGAGEPRYVPKDQRFPSGSRSTHSREP